MIVSLLGVLKAGGAYLPLDAAYPRERLAFMLEDSEAPLVITRPGLVDSLPPQLAQVVSLDEIASALEMESAENPLPQRTGDDLAYVIYTSGSTGMPKGVQIPHRAVVNFLKSMSVEPGLTAHDTLLAVTTLAFDISVLELFLPLSVGARVVIVNRETAADGGRLSAELTRSGATVMQATPATWQMLIDAGWSGAAGLKILCGGEALPKVLADRLVEKCESLWNLYGPTETTVWSTICRIEPENNSTLIGRPIANAQVYVLDNFGNPVPVGVAGELYIGGAGVARGYLKRPELTAAKFVCNRFSSRPDARLYRTGDLVRWRADGNLEFLGRLDHQIKLRGFRIECGEIEAALNRHPHVAQSVALLREDRPGDERLVAYIIARPSGPSPAPLDLRDFLHGTLPDYMVPSTFMALDAFPLTPNGKVDRQALPVPEWNRLELREAYAAPRTSVEEQLTKIWCDVLGVERVGLNDNFFDLGGHSLLAVPLFARIERQFHVRIPLARLFQQGTVAGIARCLSDSANDNSDVSVVTIQPGDESRRRLFVLPSMGGELLDVRVLIRHIGLKTPVYGLQPRLSADIVERFVDFETTAAFYAEALCKFQPQGPYALIGYSYGGILAYEVARRIAGLGGVVDLLAVVDTGPGTRGRKVGTAEKIGRAIHIMRNLPKWFRDDALQASPRDLVRRTHRTLRRFTRHWSQRVIGKRHSVELDDARDISRIATQNRALLATLFRAFVEYLPPPYAGKLTLFRAHTRSLFAAGASDLGWGRFAKGGVEVRGIPGHHKSILAEPHVRVLAAELQNTGWKSGIDRVTERDYFAHKMGGLKKIRVFFGIGRFYKNSIDAGPKPSLEWGDMPLDREGIPYIANRRPLLT